MEEFGAACVVHRHQQAGQAPYCLICVIVTPLYSAGEAPIEGITNQTLAEAIRKTGHPSVTAVASERDLAPAIRSLANPGDMVLCFGAGNSTEWAHALPQWLAEGNVT